VRIVDQVAKTLLEASEVAIELKREDLHSAIMLAATVAIREIPGAEANEIIHRLASKLD
jgi:hypothetical protein